VLASSSAGNSTFIGTDRTRILVDAGLSCKQIVERLASIGEDAAKLDAIFITHEHSDHVSGLPTLMKKLGSRVPVFLTTHTAPLLDWNNTAPHIETFQAGAAIDIGDLTIRADGLKIAIATDLGYMPDSVKFHIRDANFLLLESNHDPETLKVGPYPWHIKQRILSRKGHLSNQAACDYIAAELSSETHTLVLGHLSETNNDIWNAELCAKMALEQRGLAPRLIVAEPRKLSEIFQL
jgi:phosphoribosyl 1,2-cyclic phosphodiesterase